MTAIFISHAKEDRAIALEVAEFLRRCGIAQVFLDFHKDLGTPVGEKWERDLYDKLTRASVLLAIVSDYWIKSQWCHTEWAFARYRQRPIIPVYLDLNEAEPRFDEQGVKWAFAESREMLQRYVRDLLGADWRFEPNAGSAPFPGFRAFEKEDAAWFCGRDRETDELMRSILEASAVRDFELKKALAVVGPSGSGKSSLVKAGVLPQLDRDAYASRCRVGTPFRPSSIGGTSALGAILTLSELVSDPALYGADPKRALADLADRLSGDDASFFSVIITIDQFEEVLSLPDEQRIAMLEALNTLLTADARYQLLITARSDAVAQIQALDVLAGRLFLMPVAPLGPDAIREIIRLPATRKGLEVDADLLERMVQDAKTADALPLLAATLKEMFEFDPGATRWGLPDYERLSGGGGLSPIETAVSRRGDAALKGATPAELEALRKCFLSMSAINDNGEFERRKARRVQLPDAAGSMLENLVNARLLVADDVDGEPVVEVAHEALLRSWPLVNNWLRDEAMTMRIWNNIRRAARQWYHAPEDLKPNLLLHGAAAYASIAPLVAAGDAAKGEDRVVQDYLAACAKSQVEHFSREHEERTTLLNWLTWAPTIIVAAIASLIILTPPLVWGDLFFAVWFACSLGAASQIFPLFKEPAPGEVKSAYADAAQSKRLFLEIAQSQAGKLSGRLFLLSAGSTGLSALVLGSMWVAVMLTAGLVMSTPALVAQANQTLAQALSWALGHRYGTHTHDLQLQTALFFILTPAFAWACVRVFKWLIASWDLIFGVVARWAHGALDGAIFYLSGRAYEARRITMEELEEGHDGFLIEAGRFIVLIAALAPSVLVVADYCISATKRLAAAHPGIENLNTQPEWWLIWIFALVCAGNFLGVIVELRSSPAYKDAPSGLAKSLGFDWSDEGEQASHDAAQSAPQAVPRADARVDFSNVMTITAIASLAIFSTFTGVAWFVEHFGPTAPQRLAALLHAAAPDVAAAANATLERLGAERVSVLIVALLWALGVFSYWELISVTALLGVIRGFDLPYRFVRDVLFELTTLGRRANALLTWTPWPPIWFKTLAYWLTSFRSVVYRLFVIEARGNGQHRAAEAIARRRWVLAAKAFDSLRTEPVRQLVIRNILDHADEARWADNGDAAKESYENAISRCAELNGALEGERFMSRALHGLALLAIKQGEPDSPEKLERAFTQARIVASRPDADIEDLSRAWLLANRQGLALSETGDLATAKARHLYAQEVAKCLNGPPPTITGITRLYSSTLRLANVARVQGERDAAQTYFAEAEGYLKPLMSGSLMTPQMRIDLLEIQFRLAELQGDRGRIVSRCQQISHLRRDLGESFEEQPWMAELVAAANADEVIV